MLRLVINMSAIKDGRYPIELNGEEYHMLFSLNALDEMQDKFGGYDNLNVVFDKESKTQIKDLKWLLTLLINEGMDEGQKELSEREIGKKIHVGNLINIQNTIYKAFAHGVNGGNKKEKDEEEIVGNKVSVQES